MQLNAAHRHTATRTPRGRMRPVPALPSAGAQADLRVLLLRVPGRRRPSGTASARPAASGTRWSRSARRAARRAARTAGPVARPVPLREVSAERAPRLSTAIGELDRVLGGGLVPGSLVLLGGDRRASASRRCSQHGARAPGARPGATMLYVTGEESVAQIRLRASAWAPTRSRSPCWRRPTSSASWPRLEAERPDACVIDSVQTLHSGALESRARLGRPGARGGDAAHARWPSARAPPCCSSAT